MVITPVLDSNIYQPGIVDENREADAMVSSSGFGGKRHCHPVAM